MLTITEPAAELLSKLLDEADTPEGVAARFVVSEGSLSLEVDSPRPDDHTIEHQGKTLLVLDAQVTELLGDKTLVLEETEEGPTLVIQDKDEAPE